MTIKNTMISSKEREALQEVFDAVEKFLKAHNSMPVEEMMRLTHKSTQAEKVHSLLYMTLVKDFAQDTGALRSLLEVSEEEFIREVTENGKESLRDVEHKLMFSLLTDLIMK